MQIEKLLKSLDLGELIGEPRSVIGGLLHKMYRVVTSKGAYAVKVLNSDIMARPEALGNMINSEKAAAAFACHIHAVGAMEINGSQVHELDGRYYMIFPWTDGKSVYPPEIDENHCAAIGDALGEIHGTDITADGIELETSAADWDNYLQIAKTQGAEWTEKYENTVIKLNVWSKAACDAQSILETNTVLSHRDLDPKNVLWDGYTPYIIDWEAAGYINPYLELLQVINYWADDGSGRLRREHFDALINAYAKHMDISAAPWDAVFAAGCSDILGWLEYNLKRALGIESADKEQIKIGEEQIEITIKELYDYQNKVKMLREWFEV